MAGARIQGLTMPKWGMSMTQGKVVRWLLPEGTLVSLETDVVEIETEKITGAVQSPVAGVLRRHVALPDHDVPVGGLLAVIADAETSDKEIDTFTEQAAAEVTVEQSDAQTASPESILLGDRRIRYLKRGDGQPTVVLIHGFGGNLNNWLFNQEALAISRTVYAFELPGHGQSSKDVGDGSLGTLVQCFLECFDAIGLTDVHLVGHSLGGAIAVALAHHAPDRVRCCTLIASVGMGTEIDTAFIDGLVQANRRKQLKLQLEKLFADPGQVTRQLVDDLLKFKRLDGVQHALQAIAAQMVADSRQTINVRDQLQQLTMPTLVLWGQEDRIIPASHAQGLPDSIAVKVFPECGHMVHMEAASEVNRAIEEHFK